MCAIALLDKKRQVLVVVHEHLWDVERQPPESRIDKEGTETVTHG
jgi:hypothetical protein